MAASNSSSDVLGVVFWASVPKINATTAGLLDPAKVTRTAIENAASVAGTILTTESIVFEKKEEKNADEESMAQY